MLRGGFVALVLFAGLAWAGDARAESDLLPNVHLLEAFEKLPGAGVLVPALAGVKAEPTTETNGLLPCVLSCLIPGLGQLFNGQIIKGLVFVGAGVLAWALVASAGLTPLGFLALGLLVAVYVVSTIDAYTGGTLLPDWGAPEKPKQVITEEDVTPPTHAAADRRT